MFKELRNRFLILNLVIISVMMMISFICIYFITYNNVHRDIDRELHKISEFNRKEKEFFNQPPPNLDNVPPPPKRSISFSLITDSKGRIITISSIFDMENTFYETVKNTALHKYADKGLFKLDNNYWAFMIQPYFDGHKIIFLDITSQQGILTNLIYTFIVVASIMLIFIFFISRFFANKSIKPIKEAFDKQKQFIADASHELKTPLAIINTNVDVVLSNDEDCIKNQSKWLYYIKSEAERMTKLTNDLLYLTQMDYSDIEMIYSDFNLSETIESVILTMEAVIFENNILLEYDLESNILTYGNKEQIKQVIIILLDNAIKYTNDKGRISISLKKHHNTIDLSIINTGEGILEENLDKVFDRFYRIDKSRARKEGGYGLGLAIAKTIINQHKGKIWAKSILHESTSFHVELPSFNNK